MTIPTSSLYPSAIDNNNSLFADPVNSLTMALQTDVSDVGTEIVIIGSVSEFEVPCFLAFATGELVYATVKNNTTRQVTIERGPIPVAHLAGENIRPSVAAQYFNQLKRAILAIENTLGVNPQGIYNSVTDKLNNVDVNIQSSNSDVALANQRLTTANQNIATTQASLVSSQSVLSSIQSNQTIMNGEIAAVNAVIASGVNVIPIGTILSFPGAAAPSGFLICDGGLISRSTYYALFAIIGTTYGVGNGTTTFGIPDMRGRTPIGAGQGAGLTNRVLGGVLGEEAHTLAISEMPAHDHPYEGGYTNATYATGSANSVPAVVSTLNTGSEPGVVVPHTNMQPSIIMNFVIKF